MEEHLISIDNVFSKFQTHFETPNNTNILFSGKFGTGKSYFLNSFFKDEEISKKYNPILISPVNYSVANTEDIFELVKVDIIQNLFLKGHLKVEEPTIINKDLAFASFVYSKPVTIVKHISSLLSKLSNNMEVISSLATNIESLIKDLSKYEEVLNGKLKKDSATALDFAIEKEDIKGSYLEYNIIANIITKTLEKVKENTEKYNVLIIDDIDRLDPGHIFRILNVFSAHNNHATNSNKFMFDKVILVCDINNIEHIFRHIYGPKTDFDGYIDKFYSIEPFSFSNSAAIHFFLQNNFKIILNNEELNLLRYLCVFFEKEKILSVRKILKLQSTPFEEVNQEQQFSVDYANNNSYEDINIPYITPMTPSIYFEKKDIVLIKVFRILKILFSTYENLEEKLNEYSHKYEKSFLPNLTISDSELQKDIIKSFALINRLIKHWKSPKIFIDRKENGSIEYPMVKIGNTKVRLTFQWDSRNRYNGNGSIFDKLTLTITENRNDLTSKLIMDELLSSYKFLKHENFID